MSSITPSCPVCGDALVLTHHGELDSWVCHGGDGLALTLSETHGRLQNDEIALLWQLARSAGVPSAPRPSPTTGRPMVAVEVGIDDDEVPEGQPGDGPNRTSVRVDVDVDDQVIWFDASELDEFPLDLPDPEPSEAELEAVERIRQAFGQSVAEAAATRQDAELTERLYRRIARRPGLTSVLTSVGSLGRR